MAWPDSTSKDDGTGTANPFDRIIERQLDADTIAADSDTELGVAAADGTVNKVEFIPNATKAGADANSRTLTVRNKTLNVDVATFAMTAGNDLTIHTAKLMTLQAAANLVVAKGDVFELNSTHVGAGLTQPGGIVRVHTTPKLGQTP